MTQNKIKNPTGRMVAGKHTARTRIIEEITEIQKRLIVIKPTMQKLDSKVHRGHCEILENILTVLCRIEKGLAKKD